MEQNIGSCSCIQSVILCLSIEELSAFLLIDINDQVLLLPDISVFKNDIIVWVYMCFSSLG